MDPDPVTEGWSWSPRIKSWWNTYVNWRENMGEGQLVSPYDPILSGDLLISRLVNVHLPRIVDAMYV
jgi:hypothetical protein